MYNESSSQQCCFINARSILMVFWGLMFSWLGDITGESAASLRLSGLGGGGGGGRPFTPNLLSISRRSDAFPGLRLDPVLFGPGPGGCPRTEGRKGKRDGKGDEGGRRGGARGTEQIRNRCSHTCDSAFRN